MSINTVTISGNLTRDAELKSTGSSDVLSFSVAVNERRKNKATDEWEDYPNYIDCTVFGARAPKLAERLTKGTKICVQGKLRWSQWEDRDGGKRSRVTVIADEVELMPKGANPAASEPYADADLPF